MNDWLVEWTRGEHATLQIVAIPHAGAGAAAYAPWAALLPRDVQLSAVRLPGRENRFGEPPLTSLIEIVDLLAPVVARRRPGPAVLFGYSLGAIVAYELAARLQAMGAGVDLLAVGGTNAPQILRTGPRISAMDDHDFVDQIRALGGTPEEVFDHPELLDLVLPVLRADFTVLDDYRFAEHRVLDCPISTFSGDSDPELTTDGVRAWDTLTGATCSHHTFAGDHFFVAARAAEVVNQLLDDVRDLRMRP